MKYRVILNSSYLLLVLGLFIHGCGKQEQEKADISGGTAVPATENEPEGRDSVTFTLAGRDSVTVFQLLQESHYVESRETSMGVFVLGIDSIRGGGEGNWVYTINDTVPKIAADKMFTRQGDTVVWKFRVAVE